MRRATLFTLAYATLLGAAGPLAACASSANGDSASAQTMQADQSAPSSQPSQATEPASPYSDAQIQSFVAARGEIQQLTPGQTAEQQAANQQQIGEILQRNNLTPDVYNEIAQRSQTDQALANRIAAVSVGTAFTDAQLQAFAAASLEIDPISRGLATATPEQQAQAGEQIRAILVRHNLSQEAYNGIAARAQTDQTLAARIAQFQTAARAPDQMDEESDQNDSGQQ